MKLLNQLINIWLKLKGDTQSKIALGLLSTGVLLTAGSSFIVSISYTHIEGQTINAVISHSDSATILSTFGILLILFGTFLAIRRFLVIEKDASKKDIGLFFIPGFLNQNMGIPISSLPKLEQPKVVSISFKIIDSYEPKLIINDYQFLKKTIQDRINHSEIKKAYIAALGSVPYLYICGTMFNNGHLPLSVLEYFRAEDLWKPLDELGADIHVKYNYNQYHGDKAIQQIKSNQKKEIGLSISFTNEVKNSELPSDIQQHTLDISLDSGYKFYAISSNPIQDEIIENIHHTITTLVKKTDTIHLFICAQASIVFKLGKWYQPGMYGNIIIHNFDPTEKKYNWALEFDGAILRDAK